MNTLKLKSVMVLNGDTARSLSEFLGLSYQRFSAKINEKNGAEFTQGEIEKIRTKYSLSANDLSDIFFEQSVS